MTGHGDVEDLAYDSGDSLVASHLGENSCLRFVSANTDVGRKKGLAIFPPALPPPTIIFSGLIPSSSALDLHHLRTSKQSLTAYGNLYSGALFSSQQAQRICEHVMACMR